MTDLCARCSKILAERERVAPKLGRVHQLWIDEHLLRHAMCLEGSLYGTAALTFRVLRDGVPGALAECGVGAGVHPAAMHYCMRFAGQYRPIWLFDSFEGIPMPTERDVPSSDRPGVNFAERMGVGLTPDGTFVPSGRAAVPLERVRTFMREWGAPDEHLRFVPGWFHETLLTVDTGPLAMLRVDADTYQSTLAAMDGLYEKVSVGGYVLVHDYDFAGVRAAVVESLGREPEIYSFPGTGPEKRSVWWRKA